MEKKKKCRIWCGWVVLALLLAAGPAGAVNTGAGRDTTLTLAGNVRMAFIYVSPGTFRMGAQREKVDFQANAVPRHTVTLTRGFYLGRAEVTKEQWEAVMGARPWEGKAHALDHPDSPAVYVSWEDVNRFLERLNQNATDVLYRLPTEAEWAYACRAGTTSPWSFGDDADQAGEYAWYRENAWDDDERYGHWVMRKKPNPWGFFDMHGNVWEWVQDRYGPYPVRPQMNPPGPSTGAYRVLRGGAFYEDADGVSSSVRGGYSPSMGYHFVGFRVVVQPR